MAVEPAREPLVAVDVDLDRERESSLDLHVDQTALAVHEVAVELQALARYLDMYPPSTRRGQPVTNEASSEARNKIA
jgi:hypothetical protein